MHNSLRETHATCRKRVQQTATLFIIRDLCNLVMQYYTPPGRFIHQKDYADFFSPICSRRNIMIGGNAYENGEFGLIVSDERVEQMRRYKAQPDLMNFWADM